MKKINLEDLKQEFNNLQKQNTNKDIELNLKEELTNFFLEKADVFKLLERITKHYNITNELIIKQFLHIKPTTELTESVLKNSFKENDIPNKILTFKEKKALEEVYIKTSLINSTPQVEFPVRKTFQERQTIKEERRKSNKINEILGFLATTKTLLSSIDNFESLNSHEQKKILKSIKNKFNISEHFNKNKSILSDMKQLDFNLVYENLKQLIKKFEIKTSLVKKKKEFIKEKEKIIKQETLRTLEYQQKIKEFREKQEQELLKRIEDRKNGVLVENEKTPSKIDPIIIEAYLEDFNSERSRFVLSVITANNIHLSFYNGVIKLINEDESFDEVYFTTIGNTLKFSNEKYSKDISINTLSIEKISDILLKQSNNKIFTDMILNCLSILHYINTFYNEKEKIDVSYEDLLTTSSSSNVSKSDSNKNSPSVVYLSSGQVKKIKTIKIKKGKRGITGSFLIRGHWRKQKYTTGVKLIWIEPFWKGVEKNKQRVYKIMKGHS
jgi:hypothetical protein